MDRLERGIEALRTAQPAPPRESLPAEIAGAFDQGLAAARRRRSARRRIVGIGLAAALLLGIAAPLVWRQGAAETNYTTGDAGAARPVDEALAIQETLLQARVRSLRAVLAESASQSAEPIPTKARSAESHGLDDKSLPLANGPRAEKPTPTETTLRKIAEVASITGEPVERLYRLAAARRLEEVDRSLASARYREIVEEFPRSGAASVARARLQSLNP